MDQQDGSVQIAEGWVDCARFDCELFESVWLDYLDQDTVTLRGGCFASQGEVDVSFSYS